MSKNNSKSIKKPWIISPAEAVKLQRNMRLRLIPESRFTSTLTLITGLDVSIRNEVAYAAAVTLSLDTLSVVEKQTSVQPVRFPYIPGLLAFREAPVILEAFGKLKLRPDIILVDGHGIAHPRGCGLACHLGLELNLPSIGCAKSRLVGAHLEPDNEKGSVADLVLKDKVIGRVVRTRQGVKPVYVSTGHLVNLDTAVRIILRCLTRYRLPEPIRQAHKTAGEIV